MSPAPPSAALIVTVKHASEAPLFVKLNVWKRFVPGKPPPGHAFPSHPLGRPSRPSRSAWVGSFASTPFCGIGWGAPPVQVGTLNETVLLPFGNVRFRSKSIFVPQANELDVEIWNGVEFV